MITIVTGLPRSGTSLMMQMLCAGGLPVLSDGERSADIDNPRGYLEWERIKQLPKEPGCIAEAEGKVVKVISQLLLSLPDTHQYKIVFMQRPLAEVLASQQKMLEHRGSAGPPVASGILTKAFQSHLFEVNAWLNSQPNVTLLRVPYHRVLGEASKVAQELAQFLQAPLDEQAMVKQVDRTLYRQRGPQS